MKKNVMLRTASGLLVATLLSTSVVSGTFAKYVTSDSASDKARVAKFGVVVSAEGTIFSDTYKEVDAGNTPGVTSDYTDINSTATQYSKLSVISSSAVLTSDSSSISSNGVNGADKVVAPGTKNSTGLTFSVKGTPEVAVQVDFSVTGSDVWLGAGTYPNMTNGDVYDDQYNADDWFKVADAYYPIKYTLKHTYTENNQTKTDTLVDGKALKDVIAKLQSTSVSKKYSAGTDLSTVLGEYTLTWEWVYDATSTNDETTFYGVYDKHDTLLGDLAADGATGTMVTNAVSAVTAATTSKDETSISYPAMPQTIAAANTDPTGTGMVTAQAGKYNLNTNVNITITVKQVD